MESRTFRLRVTYRKGGRLAMLSHLEVTHVLERMVRRAGLPFALSQGFSPHMKIAFGGALPVGIGGDAEIFDLQLSRYIAPAKALTALQAAAPTDMMPASCEYVEPKAKAASVAYPYSIYEAVLASPIAHMEWPDVIEVVRKKKTRELVVDDYLVGTPKVNGDTVLFQLVSTDAGNLRPDVFLKAACPGIPLISINRLSQSADPSELP